MGGQRSIQFDATNDLRVALEKALSRLEYEPDSALLLHISGELGEIVVDDAELSREVQDDDWVILATKDQLETFLSEVERLLAD